MCVSLCKQQQQKPAMGRLNRKRKADDEDDDDEQPSGSRRREAFTRAEKRLAAELFDESDGDDSAPNETSGSDSEVRDATRAH